MNANKARDFFSAYYEGDLEAGLSQAFESALSNDAALADDYSSFVRTMELVQSADFSEAEVPFDLHDRIMARLDHQEWEEKQAAKPGLFGNWRLAFFGGLAAVAIVAAALTIWSPAPRSSRDVANFVVNPGPVVKPSMKVGVEFLDGKLVIGVENVESGKVSVREIGGSEVFGSEVGSKGLKSPLENAAEQAVALEAIVNDKRQLVVVVPGTVQGSAYEGEATVLECAKAIADAYRTPILVTASDLDKVVTWNLVAGDSTTEIAEKLAGQLSLSVRQDGLVLIQD